VLGGGLLAHAVQTAGGVEVVDVRFPLSSDTHLSGLLYLPPNATPETPAPGILAVHGYINSRETQSGFAIELARRGYVVLAMDQTGHGFSEGAALRDAFGGPAGLAYLRSLPQVDPARIGMEGHSMGGWAILAAAAAAPDAYRSIALVGSATGPAFAPPGTRDFPRNTAVIFSVYDEFSQLMWRVRRAADVPESAKLWALFGADAPVQPGRVYGAIEDGTARWLRMPWTTHPGDHLSAAAIGDVLEWMQRTVGPGGGAAGGALQPGDQIWHWKELGTLIALVGGVCVLLGTFDLLLALPWLSAAARAGHGTVSRAGPRWWIALLAAAAVPAVTYFPLMALGAGLLGIALLPQNVTNQIAVWAVANGIFALALGAVARARVGEEAIAQKLMASVGAVAALYLAVAVSDAAFQTDMRFWIVALKPMAPHHVPAFVAYVIPFTAFFYAAHRTLHATLALRESRALGQYGVAIAVVAGGVAVMVAWLYVWLFATGALPDFASPLPTIIALQLVPVLAITAIVAVFTWRRTDGPLAGALVCGMLATWYVVAGQATHV
jgi:dienelactone hydrolase